MEPRPDAIRPDRRRDADPSKAGKPRPASWWRLRLRGRWHWVLLGGVAAAGVAAAIAWWSARPLHEARGQVVLGIEPDRVAAAEEAIGPGESGWAAAPRLDVVAERELDRLRRLAGVAAVEPGDDAGPDAKGGVSLSVERSGPAGGTLTLTARSDAADAAADAVRSVLAGFMAQADRLESEAAQYAAYRAARQGAATAIAAAAAARARATEARRDAAETESIWADTAESLVAATRAADRAAQRLESLRALAKPTAAEVAALDPEAAVWWGRARGLERALAETAWPPSPAVATRLRERATLEARLRARAADSRVVPVGDGGLAFRAVRLSAAEREVEQTAAAAARAEAEAARLRPQVQALRNWEAEADHAEAEAAAEAAALANLDPGPGVALLSVRPAPGGDGPTSRIVADPRPRLSLTAGLAGLLLGVGLVQGVFLLDRRVRSDRQGRLIGSPVPTLAALPAVEDDAAATSGVGGAAAPSEVSSIQSVRAVLEGRMAAGPGAFAVAGVAPGSGATSVAVGLAASMAISGSRVLLIDLAWLQKPAGDGSDDEATAHGLGVDGVVQQLGYLEDEDREAIALAEEDAGVGFGAMLSGASLRRSVVRTRLGSLSILSAMGRGEALRRRWAGRVSSRWLGKLMEVAKNAGYAAVVVDCGSATGSVEGMLGCAAADGTLVVVSPGETQAAYDKAVTRLGLVGAGVIGTVLNRGGVAGRDAQPRTIAGTRARRPVGPTAGSGIFAAAVEARVGGDGALLDAPLPWADEPSADSPAEPALGLYGRSIPAGVDPVTEPPAAAGPTPTRTPPGAAAAHEATNEPPENPESSEALVAPEVPEVRVQVSDDVMDQLVDRAIRSAERQPRPERVDPHAAPTPADEAT
ncbi:MAG: hypothetical protein AAF800_03590 [Planctomycetota bacterium]